MKIINVVSVCCNAEVRTVGGLPDFIGDKYACTMYYICTECNKPCDIKEDKSNGKKKR